MNDDGTLYLVDLSAEANTDFEVGADTDLGTGIEVYYCGGWNR